MHVCIFVCIIFRSYLGHYDSTCGLLLSFLSKYIMYVLMNCTFRANHILCKFDLTHCHIIIIMCILL